MNSEVGGFWEAFLAAGAASLIATLSYVDPLSAQMLARQFYREWLSGEATKAEALRRAQLWMRSHRPEPEHWATHILIGDHR